MTVDQLLYLYAESVDWLADLRANGAPAVLITDEANRCFAYRTALVRAGVDPETHQRPAGKTGR